MDVVVKTLRSILNTTKNGLSEMQLHNIYREMEGDDIPYGKFHFETLYDFLYASNEFHLFKLRGGLFIRARPKKHSQHIVNMRFGHNMKSPRNQPKWNRSFKAEKIKANNRMNMKREFGQNRRVNGNEAIDPMLTLQNNNNNNDDDKAVHFWLRSFFRQVRFLFKQIAANAIIYDENHMEWFNEMMKICVWKEIAHDYRGLSLQDDSSEDAEHTQNGLSLKNIKKLAQDELNAFVKKLRYCSKYGPTNQLNHSDTFYSMDSPEQAEITDHGLVDFLQIVSFILECIVANPALYEHNNQLYRDESIKFSIWNHICTVYYGKLQNNDFELRDEDVNFELKYLQRTIERHFNRLTKSLTLSTALH